MEVTLLLSFDKEVKKGAQQMENTFLYLFASLDVRMAIYNILRTVMKRYQHRKFNFSSHYLTSFLISDNYPSPYKVS